jgi:hypothetical protein
MRPPPPMSDDEADFAFMEAISSFISLISVVIFVFHDLISSMRSAMVGSDMLVAWTWWRLRARVVGRADWWQLGWMWVVEKKTRIVGFLIPGCQGR